MSILTDFDLYYLTRTYACVVPLKNNDRLNDGHT